VSKVKSATEKKALSLKRDRRNTYGENPQASRKGIRRGKQRSHMEERRSVGKILSHLRESAEESDVIEADVLSKTSLVRSKHKAFKKMPDRPLGEVIKRKQAKREESQSRGKDATPKYPNIYPRRYLTHLTFALCISEPSCFSFAIALTPKAGKDTRKHLD